MLVLGIDPGVATIGYGLIRFEKNKFTPIEYGAIRTPARTALASRLMTIYDELSAIIMRTRPDALSVEELFFNDNAKTAISVGQGRGVILLAGAKQAIPVFEYTPLQVKQAVTGYGRADKNQVQQMVKTLLNLKEVPKPDDTADALAVAICHAHSAKSAMLFR